MLLVSNICEDIKIHNTKDKETLFGLELLKQKRSEIPAVTHVDYSARVQTVNGKNNKKFFNLLKKFFLLTGCPVLINTSFNVRGEPIVLTPEDSYRCFMRTGIDLLVIENFVFLKSEQPNYKDHTKWQEEFTLD